MSKKIRNCFYKNLTFDKLLQAHLRARKHKTYKSELINFEINLENNLINLKHKILTIYIFSATVIGSIYDKTIDIWTAFIVSLDL